MRESYRLHKQPLYESLVQANKKLIMAFVYNSEEKAEFIIIDREIKQLLAQLNSRLRKIEPGV
jgi:hypothetical protein